MSATATDMANFMIAHLQYGSYENSRILKADTVRLMHEWCTWCRGGISLSAINNYRPDTCINLVCWVGLDR
ncbi:MAG: hypothetical protein KME38_23390 [Spirirestis rafaelensis WJT71-NPBG6]|jgi:CubicO group peptidase (beta-lactamase class C family)|nr:hypothetical protein [Spirirestis rafaelensis WJT71-NPBG6]